MGLVRYRLGDLIQVVDERNSNGIATVLGLNREKQFMPTVANTESIDLSKYKVVKKGRFAFSGMQTGRDKCIRIGIYDTDFEKAVISPAYTTFEVSKSESIDPTYLFMLFNSKERDRLGWFCSDSSIRSNLDWDRFCDFDLRLPPVEIQQKYVDIYNAMVANQKCYEESLEDLKLACDAELEALMSEMEMDSIGGYIQLTDERNNGIYSSDDVRGISIEKVFIPTKAKMDGVSVKNYKIVEPRDIAYVPVTSRNGGKITIAQNVEGVAYLISSAYTSFRCNETKLLPEYLMLFFTRPEFDRYARFHSWGSAREVFSWDDMRDVRIPIPDIKTQQSLANLFTAYNQRKEINECMKTQIKDICPILIKGSLEEASKA